MDINLKVVLLYCTNGRVVWLLPWRLCKLDQIWPAPFLAVVPSKFTLFPQVDIPQWSFQSKLRVISGLSQIANWPVRSKGQQHMKCCCGGFRAEGWSWGGGCKARMERWTWFRMQRTVQWWDGGSWFAVAAPEGNSMTKRKMNQLSLSFQASDRNFWAPPKPSLTFTWRSPLHTAFTLRSFVAVRKILRKKSHLCSLAGFGHWVFQRDTIKTLWWCQN